MARHKVNTPAFENTKEKRAIKDAKRKILIFRIFTYVYSALLISTLIITGFNNHNATIFGWGYITMSLITLGAIAFVIYTEVKGWHKNYSYWKDYELDPWLVESRIGKEEFKNDLTEHRVLMIFIGLIYLGLAIYMLVSGIRALLGYPALVLGA